MRTPAETRALYPAGPGTTYSMFFCDGVKILDELERVTFIADSDADAIVQAREAMQNRPAHEVGVLDRPVKRGHSVWVADIGRQGDRAVTADVDTAWEMHHELHGCGSR